MVHLASVFTWLHSPESLRLVSIFWWSTGTAQTAEVLFFRGFTGVGTAVYWEVLAICWPSSTRLTKSAFSPLGLSNPLDSSQSWASSCPCLKMAGAGAERSEERHCRAHVGCESCSSLQELGGSRQSSRHGNEQSCSGEWQRNAELVVCMRSCSCCRGGKHHGPVPRWPAALVGVWHWRGLLWLMVIITYLECDTKIIQ